MRDVWTNKLTTAELIPSNKSINDTTHQQMVPSFTTPTIKPPKTPLGIETSTLVGCVQPQWPNQTLQLPSIEVRPLVFVVNGVGGPSSREEDPPVGRVTGESDN